MMKIFPGTGKSEELKHQGAQHTTTTHGDKENMVKLIKTHEFTIKVQFDKPVSKYDALQEMRNNLKGEEFFLSSYTENYPDRVIVKTIKKVPIATTSV